MEVCHSCVVGFVKTLKGDVTCMDTSCKHPWSRVFLINSLPASIVYGEIKEQRKEALVDREKALLPVTSQLVPLINEETTIKQHISEDRAALKALKERIKQAETTLAEVRHRKRMIEMDIRGIARQPLPANTIATKEENTPPVEKVVCPCPGEGCRGFVFSRQMACSICSTKVCRQCHGVLNEHEVHECRQEDIASIKLIKKECKPCPSCGTLSRKTEGCSQVWCLVCHNAWNWNTGAIEKGYIHATDYYEYMRRNGMQIPARPNANPERGAGFGCGRMRPQVAVVSVRERFGAIEEKFMFERWQIANELLGDDQPRNDAQDPHELTHVDLRIKYLQGEIDDTKWKQLLHKRDKEFAFKNEINRMCAAYGVIIRDAIIRVCKTTDVNLQKTEIDNVHAIHDLMQEEYVKLAKNFQSKRASPFIRAYPLCM